MQHGGLVEVANRQFILEERLADAVVRCSCCYGGTRPILVECRR